MSLNSKPFTLALSTLALAGVALSTAAAGAPPSAPAQTPVTVSTTQAAPVGEAAPTEQAYASTKKVTKTTNGLNVRKSASTKGKKLGTLKKGQQVTVKKTAKNGWKYISAGKLTGWASGKYLKTTTVKVTSTKKATTTKAIAVVKAPTVKNATSKLPRPNIYWEDLNWRTKHPVSSKNTTKVRAYVSGGEGSTVQLQRWTGTKWVTVSTGKVKNWIANLKMEASDKAERTDYFRLYIPATKSTADFTTKAMKIARQNPDKFTGEKKQIYGYIKKSCPQLAIELHAKNKKYDGLAYLGYDSVAIVSGYTKDPAYLKLVSLHECSHHLQYAVANKNGGWDKFQARTNKIYGQKGTLGMEMNATCTAKALGAKLRKGAAYTTNCTGARGTAGTAVAKGRMP